VYGQPASHEFHGPVRARIRRELRLQTTASAATGEPISVLIHNLSQAGMLIETLADLRKGEMPRDQEQGAADDVRRPDQAVLLLHGQPLQEGWSRIAWYVGSTACHSRCVHQVVTR